MQTNELHDMREQLELLKRKVEREKQLGEKQILYAMRKKVSYINRQGQFFAIFSLLMIPFFFWSRNVLPVSKLFCGVTCGFFAVSALYNHIIHNELSAEDVTREYLLNVAHKLITLKRNYNRWLFFSIPFVMVWILWYFYELRTILSPESFGFTITCSLVGGVIGSLIGVYKHLQVQRSCSELLEQIEEVRGEE